MNKPIYLPRRNCRGKTQKEKDLARKISSSKETPRLAVMPESKHGKVLKTLKDWGLI